MNLINRVINSNLKIREAIEILSNVKSKTLMIEENKKIIGVFTEGDFRKAVLKGVDIDNKIKQIINKRFKFIKEKVSKREIIKIFKENPLIQDLPVLNQKKSLKGIIDKDVFFNKKKNKHKNIDIIIMAGGLGTRLDPFTKILPKPLLPIGNSTILEIIIKSFSSYGFENFILSLNDKKNIIKSYLKENLRNKSIKIVEEKKPLGTIGALKLIEKKVSNLFFLTNCDTISKVNFKDIVDHHLKNKSDLTIVSTFKNFKIPYGVFKAKNNGNLIKLQEKPSLDNLVNCGLYLMNKNIIKSIPKNKKFDADELIQILLKKRKKIKIFPISEEAWKDYGIWKEYFKNI